jgi:homoserine dehydrogenase
MSVKVALLGFGVVGKGTYRSLTQNAAEIERKTGKKIEVKYILERRPEAINSGIAPVELFTQDFDKIVNDPEVKIVAEIIGGKELATSFMLRALKAGKHVVTPNKAVIAADYELFHKTAEENGVCIKYEASVGGAIPVIETIRNSLVANRITKVEGIVNGTTNYILTKMEEDNNSYADALKQAQAKGFAEADPTADVEGIDSANKLSILIAECFGIYIKPTDLDRTGITKLTRDDLRLATQNGCKLKLLASAELMEDGSVKAFVKPTQVPMDNPLSTVRNEFNAIYLHCNMADKILLTGRGAGKDPTGSAMAADIVDLA